MESGQGGEEAVALFAKSIAANPDGGLFAKFLYAAQLAGGSEAEQLYLKVQGDRLVDGSRSRAGGPELAHPVCSAKFEQRFAY